MNKLNECERAFPPPLVNKRNNAATFKEIDPEKLSEEVKYQAFKNSRLTIYKAQNSAAKIGVSRVRICNIYRRPLKMVQVWNTTREKMVYHNLIHCTSVWTCPICSYKIKNERKNQVNIIMEGLQKEGYRLVFLTLTKSHKFTLDKKKVKELFQRVNSDYRKITAMRHYKELKKEYGIEYIKALEATYQDANGFHPHLHIVLAFAMDTVEARENSKHKLYSMASWIRKEWLKMNPESLKEYSHIKIVYDEGYEAAVKDYITKLNLSYELTNPLLNKQGSGINPLQIPFLLVGEKDEEIKKHLKEVFNIYEIGSKGCRFITFSKGLKKRYLNDNEKTDEEIVNEVNELTEIELYIQNEAWAEIVRVNKRAELLDILEMCKKDHTKLIDLELLTITEIELKINLEKLIYV